MTSTKPASNYDQLSKADLIKLLRNKDIEINDIKNVQMRDAFNHTTFLQNFMRDEYWEKIRVSEGFSSDRYEMMS